MSAQSGNTGTNTDKDHYTKTIEMGAVELKVRELGPMRSFYEGLVGLKEISSQPGRVELGDGEALIILVEDKNLAPALEHEAGLYHTALVFPTQAKLAKTLLRIFSSGPRFYQGSADHLATEAFYFGDPEGNGVELYYDRPRSQWQYGADGKPLMGSVYIDERGFVQNHMEGDEGPDPVRMGHVHLKIGDIAKAKEFYLKAFGFDEIAYMPTALFVSRDGYHHHIGMNVWHSRGAGQRKPGFAGLGAYELKFLDKKVYESVLESLGKAGVPVSDAEIPTGTSTKTWKVVSDPWGTEIRIALV